MSNDDITTKAGFFARSRKAFAAALAGGAAAATPALTATLSDGVFDWATEFWLVATPTLGFALVAFLGVWYTPNSTQPPKPSVTDEHFTAAG